MSVDEKVQGSANDLEHFVKMFAEHIRRKEQRQVSYDNPGTILTQEEFSVLARHIGEEVILIIGSYEWGDEDSEGGKWNSPIDFERKTIMDGLFGYRKDDAYVLTHIAGRSEMAIEYQTQKLGEILDKPDELYVLTAWSQLIRAIKTLSGETLFENSHLSFYYRTVNWEPAPGLYDRGMDFHSNCIAVANGPREGNINHFLARGSISDLVKRDLNGNVIVELA